ncbi:hypothetical protein B7493_21480, partial [Mycobacterium tuberculosis variant bovis]
RARAGSSVLSSGNGAAGPSRTFDPVQVAAIADQIRARAGSSVLSSGNGAAGPSRTFDPVQVAAIAD